MPTVFSLIAIVVALKLVESWGGLELDGWESGFGAAVVLWFGGWGTFTVLAWIVPSPESMESFNERVVLSLGLQAISTMILLLVAWAVVPGLRIKRLSGLLVATFLIVVLDYAQAALIPAMGMGF